MELGGKSAMIVCDDADFAAVLPSAAAACMHAGQGCALQTRVLLPRSRYDEGVAILTAVMQNIPYGDPKDMSNIQGPQISALQRDRVQGHIDRAVAQGARLVVGGGRPAHLPKGYFIEPTLFVDVDNSMAIAQEEVFGPVLAVIPYDDDEDAIRPHPHRLHLRQRRLQDQRHRPTERHRGLRAVHRDQTGGLALPTPTATPSLVKRRSSGARTASAHGSPDHRRLILDTQVVAVAADVRFPGGSWSAEGVPGEISPKAPMSSRTQLRTSTRSRIPQTPEELHSLLSGWPRDGWTGLLPRCLVRFRCPPCARRLPGGPDETHSGPAVRVVIGRPRWPTTT
ncbi:MAG: Aldehyde Dehydrogenase [Arthrobacter sp.]|nr:Aldehyde Dehydrogenase [Arthrobacter sp.]